MWIPLLIVTAWSGWRLGRQALGAWRQLPRSNRDWIFY